MSIEQAKEIFDAGIADNKSRDMIIVGLVQSGISLNTSQNLYKEFALEAGLTSAKVGYRVEALAYLTVENYEIGTAESRADVRAALVEKFGVANSTANDYIKAYAESAGIELPRSSFGSNPEDQAKIFDWIAASPDCEKAEFAEFMKTTMGRSSGSIDETYRGLVLARKLAAQGIEFSAVPEEA